MHANVYYTYTRMHTHTRIHTDEHKANRGRSYSLEPNRHNSTEVDTLPSHKSNEDVIGAKKRHARGKNLHVDTRALENWVDQLSWTQAAIWTKQHDSTEVCMYIHACVCVCVCLDASSDMDKTARLH